MAKEIDQYTPLDPETLSTPFEVQTKWHVFTGAARCGKTTLIDLMAAKGYKTIVETARFYLENEIAKGRLVEEIFKDTNTEPCILEMQLEYERGLGAQETVFLDRALPDSLPFYRFHDLDTSEVLAECYRYRYASIFLLDQLPLKLDGVRLEDETYTQVLDDWLYRDYTALGYQVVRVPVLPPEERVEFVLDKISESAR